MVGKPSYALRIGFHAMITIRKAHRRTGDGDGLVRSNGAFNSGLESRFTGLLQYRRADQPDSCDPVDGPVCRDVSVSR